MTFAPRPDFDLALPFQTSAAIATKGKRFESGKPFPWRELGIHEADLFALWHAGQVDVIAGRPAAVSPPKYPQQPQRPQQHRR